MINIILECHTEEEEEISKHFIAIVKKMFPIYIPVNMCERIKIVKVESENNKLLVVDYKPIND